MLLHVNYVQSTCTECMSCYVILCLLCYAIVVVVWCLVLRISVPSLTLSFCASDNKRLVTCNISKVELWHIIIYFIYICIKYKYISLYIYLYYMYVYIYIYNIYLFICIYIIFI